MKRDFWSGRKVLLTGHTGFKGSWMSRWLAMLGADVTGFALAPVTTPNLWDLLGSGTRSIIGDVRDAGSLERLVRQSQPEIVIHMAAQSLVRASYRDPLGTYAINVVGTANVLQACRCCEDLKCVLVITSDKVYENTGAARPFAEGDRLGGHDPYSSSKACAELVTQSMRDSFFRNGPPIATARAGNVIGGGDWSEDRLVPDCVRALASGKPVHLRYPDAIRPWQHVLESLSGYLTLMQSLTERPDTTPLAVNFGPDKNSFHPVRNIVEAFSAHFNGRPGWLRDTGDHPPEAVALTLDSTLAQTTLDWQPRLDAAAALAWTAEWYRVQIAGEDMLSFSIDQIAEYEKLLHQ